MRRICDSILLLLKNDRYLCLLIMLVLILVVAPVIERQVFGSLMKHIFLTGVFISSVFANRQRRKLTTAAIIVAALAMPVVWGAFVSEEYTLSMASFIIEIAFLVMTTLLIIISVLRDHMASVQSVYGAICIYLMIGLTWALMYSALEFAEPASFNINEKTASVTLADGREMTSYSQMVYFSFVTMSTLGFGDMTPRTPIAQTMTWMQAVAGQFYLAVLVARLISALPATSKRTIANDDAE